VNRQSRSGWFALALLAAVGCVAPPNFTNPGTAIAQQGRAQQFDPFPQTEDLGTNVPGFRPREFQQPIPEANRARWVLPSGPRSCPNPPPPVDLRPSTL
jgi:hypothetical protein